MHYELWIMKGHRVGLSRKPDNQLWIMHYELWMGTELVEAVEPDNQLCIMNYELWMGTELVKTVET